MTSLLPAELLRTPCDIVYEHYNFPFNPRPFQREVIDELGWLGRSGSYLSPGLGKTFTSTVIALLKKIQGDVETTLVLMPPILDRTWRKFLGQVTHKDGTPLRVLSYRGTPAQRREMKLDGDFILMSMQIFKKDHGRIDAELGHTRVHVIVDEATCLKNVASDNHKKFRNFVAGHSFQLLTGTPLTTPMDAYAYVKLLAPSIYSSLAQFKRIHIEELDFYGNPKKWGNLDLLQENMSLNASFVRKEDVLLDLPAKNVIPLEYDLDPAHLKLYHHLVDAQLLQLPDGTKIDATQAQALRHALGQIIMSWGHFAGDPSKIAAGFDLIEETLDEIGDAKLVVFANYRMTNRAIVEHFREKYGAVAVYGDVSAKDKERNIARFCDDPSVRLITLQPKSGGVGVDGLQQVCSDCLFIEPPITPADWNQALSRLWRDGQTFITNVRMAVAYKTLQVRGVQGLVFKEELVMPLQYSKAELRGLLLGE